MKTQQLIIASILSLGLGACSIVDKQVEDSLRKNPEIIFKVIEDNPEAFIASLNRAVKSAQAKATGHQDALQAEMMQEEVKNPKKPKIEKDWILMGPADAPITVVEYGDFQCSYCAVGAKNFYDFKEKYPGKVRFVFKHMPLDFHPQAMKAAQAFELIRMESKDKALKFYEMAYSEPGVLNSESDLEGILKTLGYSWKQLQKSKNLDSVKKRIAADMKEFENFGYRGTPVFILNGLSLQGAQPVTAFEKAHELTSSQAPR